MGASSRSDRGALRGWANVSTLWAQVLVDELIRCGLRHAVIAPGSRSAPLVFQFAARDEINDVSIVDERAAAFYALGMSRSLGQPVALLCTSGTAAANFFPAVCEAAADDVALLVLTADRPLQDHDCGAQQVMDQYALYGCHVRLFHQLAQPEADSDKLAYLRATACRAWGAAVGPRAGPVHLDLPFQKPLEPVETPRGHPGALPDGLLEDSGVERHPAWIGRAEGAPWIRRTNRAGTLGEADLARLAAHIDRSRRPVMLAGGDHRSEDYRDVLRDLAEHAGVPVLADATSGLRHWSGRGDHVIGASELLADAGALPLADADLVLRVGHPPLTWAAQRSLGASSRALHVQIGPSRRLLDPDRLVAEQLIGEPSEILAALIGRTSPANAERRERVSTLSSLERIALAAIEEGMEEHEDLTAPRLWFELGRLLPKDSALVFSSSMLVRHLETFMCGHRDSLAMHFNRGLNGIDGVVATSAGISAARCAAGARVSSTVLVIGDVALRHDLASLLIAVEQQLDLTVVVVDNGGGEIFEYLPSARFPGVHEKHFATSESLAVSTILPRAVDFEEPNDWVEFRACVTRSLARRGLKVIRVAVDRRGDLGVRRRLMQRVATAVERHPDQAAHDG